MKTYISKPLAGRRGCKLSLHVIIILCSHWWRHPRRLLWRCFCQTIALHVRTFTLWLTASCTYHCQHIRQTASTLRLQPTSVQHYSYVLHFVTFQVLHGRPGCQLLLDSQYYWLALHYLLHLSYVPKQITQCFG